MKVTIITDASWCPKTKVAGYSGWIACERGKIRFTGTLKSEVDSSNIAELMGLCNVVQRAGQEGYIKRGDELLLQTDCMNTLHVFNGHREKPNAQEKLAINFLYGLASTLNLKIKCKHVKGHTSINDARSITNRLCDKAAKSEMRKARAKKFCQQMRESL